MWVDKIWYENLTEVVAMIKGGIQIHPSGIRAFLLERVPMTKNYSLGDVLPFPPEQKNKRVFFIVPEEVAHILKGREDIIPVSSLEKEENPAFFQR